MQTCSVYVKVLSTSRRWWLLNDEDILRLMKSSDTRGLEEAMKKYKGLVLSIAAKMLESDSDCDEVVSDTFFKLWRYRFEIDPERRSFKGFLCMVAKSCTTDKLRSLNRIKRQRWRMVPLDARVQDNIPDPTEEEMVTVPKGKLLG